MKSNKYTLSIRWALIGTAIVCACVFGGFAIVHILRSMQVERINELSQERRKARRLGPLEQRALAMSRLVEKGKTNAIEAFELIDQAQESPFPEASFLKNSKGQVLASHISPSFKKATKSPATEKEFQISPEFTYQVMIVHAKPPGDRFGPGQKGHHPPPRFGRDRGPKGPPPGAIRLAAITIGLSVIVGVCLSILLLTLYLRKKAREAARVMHEIKSGNLKARFDIGSADEAGMLLGRFNEMADQIESLVANLQETERSRTFLLQELAHDFRTPVASLKSLQETLFTKAEKLSPEKKELIQKMANNEVEYFERLVEDLLFLSGVNDPRYNENFRPVDLTSILSDEASMLIATAITNQPNIQIKLKLDPGVSLRGDEHLLRRFIKNALSNATRFATEEVEVSLRAEQEQIVISIQDDGPGFGKADLENFGNKKFSRKLEKDKSGHISIGLGSVIMNKIVSLHDGKLSAENTDKGAKLSAVFPN